MSDYKRIADAIRYIEENVHAQPSPDDVASAIGMSVSHFHRLFRRWAGITPKNFLQHLTMLEARKLLIKGNPVLDTALEVGLSGPGRLHDLCVSFEAASPGEIASKGIGWEMKTGFCETPFGEALIAQSPRGICRIALLDSPSDRDAELENTRTAWSEATLTRDDESATAAASRIFSGETTSERDPIQVYVRGTKFQVKVWRALLTIKKGELTTYGEIADRIQSPNAHRAVGSAIGKNDLAFLIPCHRVIQVSGRLGGYRWGETRKKSMIAFEQAQKFPERSSAV